MPDVYVDFVQGGNNLHGLFIPKTENISWNLLFAVVSSIYTPALSGQGDLQTVVGAIFGIFYGAEQWSSEFHICFAHSKKSPVGFLMYVPY